MRAKRSDGGSSSAVNVAASVSLAWRTRSWNVARSASGAEEM